MRNIFLAASIFASILCFPLAAHAGQFRTNNYGPATSSDIAYVVTDKFTSEYPAKKWQIYLYSTSGITDDGTEYCVGIAGVTPRESNEMPISRVQDILFTKEHPNGISASSLKEFAVKCASDATAGLMEKVKKGEKVYIPY